jgi:hypothetical protein
VLTLTGALQDPYVTRAGLRVNGVTPVRASAWCDLHGMKTAPCSSTRSVELDGRVPALNHYRAPDILRAVNTKAWISAAG